MTTQPRISSRPAAEGNYTRDGRGIHPILLLVLHTPESKDDGAGEFVRVGSHKSAHAGILKDGTIEIFMLDRDVAWHAGNWLVNVSSLGVEVAGFHDDKAGPPAEQWAALVWWCAQKCAVYRIPIQRGTFDADGTIAQPGLVAHAEVPNPDDPSKLGGKMGHVDPGDYLDLDRLVAAVQALADAQAAACV